MENKLIGVRYILLIVHMTTSVRIFFKNMAQQQADLLDLWVWTNDKLYNECQNRFFFQ